MNFNIIHLAEIGSTNTYLRENIHTIEAPAFIYADIQNAGRGQRGNTWLSEPYANLLFSALWKPANLPANKQFSLSEAVALSIVEALASLHVTASVKWPNDIYVDDRKICGILIENALMGTSLEHSIIGAGINLNQRSFPASLPNPVSVHQITGVDTDIDAFISTLLGIMTTKLQSIETEDDRTELHHQYMRTLWRGDGTAHPFRNPVTGETFLATIIDVEPMGHLRLRTTDGSDLRYAFKEVEFVL
jgi:BirA family biotin operon repressor/biotin-[acetyl-CoA-carboxylase] ligase